MPWTAEPPPRLTGEEIARMMESECAAEAKAHLLLDEIGEDAFIDALRARGLRRDGGGTP